MANTLLTQRPLYDITLVGQNLYFSVTNDQDVATQTKVKFCAEVYISNDLDPNITNPSSPDFVGIFKTTPNNFGVGMWDMRNITETFISSDNLGAEGSEFKSFVASKLISPPIQNINKFSLSENMVCKLRIRFYTEFLGADPSFPNVVRPSGNNVESGMYVLINGYVKHTDIIRQGAGGSQFNYAYDLFRRIIFGGILQKNKPKFLTNAPNVLECNMDDYGTLSMVVKDDKSLTFIRLVYRDSNGNILNSDNVYVSTANGAFDYYTGRCKQRVLHFGCYPANLRNYSGKFIPIFAQMYGGTISVQGYTVTPVMSGTITEEYIIKINCPTLKGYEPIRLKWLNQYGAWDYFTFNKKSTRQISTEGSTYTQLDGTWNNQQNRIYGHRGGTKSFRVNATEKIKMNTDYLPEEYNI